MTTVSVLTSPSSFQQLIDRARLTLKDDDKVRYPDDSRTVGFFALFDSGLDK